MVVSDVRIKKFENKALKGFATITLDGVFVVSGLQIVDGKNGLFVSFPKSKGSDGIYHDNVFPLNKELREHINNTVIDAFNKA